MTFATPLRDMRFALRHMADFGALAGAYPDLSDDLTDAILEEAGKFCDNVLAPLNWTSDRQGAVLENGVVRTTPGFDGAYRQYVDGGWNALAFPAEDEGLDIGGQGLPSTLAVALVDAMNASCMSFAIGTTLTTGAVKALLHAGTPDQKRRFLPKLVSGEWTGTMNLTEPQAGSDLSDMRTKAEPIGDGRYKISGQKIYITYGDHDLTDNIVHLVLARLPDAPAGTGGISMFLVPKVHVDEAGAVGARNDVQCVGLEEKMGLHGSPTCVMAYGEAGDCVGELLGAENKGLRNMFVMMNSARLDVGVQGVGVAERAYQHALAYALERRQGRAPGVKSGDQIAIFEHPDVRRMLYAMKAATEASRGICYANAVAYDRARHGESADERAKARALEDLLTPISKAWSTDRAIETASYGVQVHGGMGYVEETGAAQFARDVRIAAIYEGTNGIQAMDLVGRKLQADGGAAARDFIDAARETAGALQSSGDPGLAVAGARLEQASDALAASTDWLLARAAAAPDDVLAGATPYLKQFGNVAGGHYLGRGALSVRAEGDASYASAKAGLTHFYAETFLAEAAGLTPTVCAGAAAVEKRDPALLSA
ncbi:MAG: acyl-CoA dehydrogenase [Pseudomonadota bacterium]